MIALDRGPVRLVAAATAVLAGLAVGWLAVGWLAVGWPADGGFGVLAVLAVLLAGGNGYEKAYSP
ncbi:MAG TPA: hypothetical protein VMR00_02110 [Streptosporangiaceae bacterium]|jgi:hypothetical protein|nr:hypothetical protein [Streptosporangiaceae bacterium]